jgi:hypothetical protein
LQNQDTETKEQNNFSINFIISEGFKTIEKYIFFKTIFFLFLFNLKSSAIFYHFYILYYEFTTKSNEKVIFKRNSHIFFYGNRQLQSPKVTLIGIACKNRRQVNLDEQCCEMLLSVSILTKTDNMVCINY